MTDEDHMDVDRRLAALEEQAERIERKLVRVVERLGTAAPDLSELSAGEVATRMMRRAR